MRPTLFNCNIIGGCISASGEIEIEGMAIDPRTDKLIRRTIMVGTVTAAYFLLTADYGPHGHALLPIKRAIESAKSSLKSILVGRVRTQDTEDNSKRDDSK